METCNGMIFYKAKRHHKRCLFFCKQADLQLWPSKHRAIPIVKTGVWFPLRDGELTPGLSQLLRSNVRLNLRAQRAKLKSRRDDPTIAQGKRGTSAALGIRPPPPFFPLSPRGTSGERGKRGLAAGG